MKYYGIMKSNPEKGAIAKISIYKGVEEVGVDLFEISIQNVSFQQI